MLNKLISAGNTKLGSNIAIFNMASATNCPSRKLGLCKAVEQGAKCYALKAEYPYRPQVLPYRERQAQYWHSVTASDFVSQFLALNTRKRKKFDAIRLNEAGDFHGQGCVDKAEQIASELKKHGVKVYCYTSRNDLDFSNCKNLVINGSGFLKSGIKNIFKIVKNEKDAPKGYGVCAGDCRVCNRCQIKGNKTAVLKH